MGAYATTRAVTGDLDAHIPCKYPASPVPIPGVRIEVVCGTRGCPGVMDTCDYRLELIYGSTTDTYGIIERHEVNLRRVETSCFANEYFITSKESLEVLF